MRTTTTSGRYREKHFGKKFVACLIIGMPLAAVGAALCVTIIGIPIGLPLMMLSGAPLGKLIVNHDRRQQEWTHRPTVMPNEATPPWLVDEPEVGV
jgi:hypothetical protein